LIRYQKIFDRIPIFLCYPYKVFWRRSSAGQSMRLISAESGVQVPASLPDITMPPLIGGFVFLEVTKGILVQIPGTNKVAAWNILSNDNQGIISGGWCPGSQAHLPPEQGLFLTGTSGRPQRTQQISGPFRDQTQGSPAHGCPSDTKAHPTR
jgi:hypothetical protein